MALPASFNIFHQVQAKATSYRANNSNSGRSTTPLDVANDLQRWRRVGCLGLISRNRLMRISDSQIFRRSMQACMAASSINSINIKRQYLSLVGYQLNVKMPKAQHSRNGVFPIENGSVK